MGKTLYMSIILAAILSSCNKGEAVCAGDGTSTINVSFTGNSIVTTKAGQGSEDKINDAQLMLFNPDGELYRYHALTAAEITAMSVTVTKVNIGDYTLALVANGPADLNTTVTTLSGLKARTLLLKDYNATGSDFVMWGTTDVTVTADAADVSVPLKRHVGRVSVSKITNGIPAAYGSLTVNSVMLTNVYANVTMEGNAVSPETSVWYNMEGRSDTSSPLTESHIIDGVSYVSQCADLTFRYIGTSVDNGKFYDTEQYLYGYMNGSDTAPAGFVTSYPDTGYKVCMVVTATFNGHQWYYPVVLESFEANTTCDVQMTIIGEGSTDPNSPVKKGSVKTSITVADWTTGKSYNKII